MKELNLIDVRSIKKWCHRHDVLIIDNEFVIESEFREVRERPFINKLKSKFGKEWESVYRLYADGNIPALNDINTISINPLPIYKGTNPENKFLKKVIEYERKKKNAA